MNPLTESEVNAVLEMRRQGDSKRTIARALNRHESRVAEAIANAKLPASLPRTRGPAALPVPYCMDDLTNSARSKRSSLTVRQRQPAPFVTYTPPVMPERMMPDPIRWWERCNHGSTAERCPVCR